MPSGAPAGGLSLSDWISLGSLIATIVGLPLALIGAHFHSAVRSDVARPKIIQRLTSTRGRDLYHDYLRTGLNWLDEKIGPPPAHVNSKGGRGWGIKALGVCFALSLAYSVVAYLAGLVAGGPAGLGQVALIGTRRWTAFAWVPEWLPRTLPAIVVVMVGVWLLWRMPIMASWAERASYRLGERIGWHLRPRLRASSGALAEVAAGAVVIGFYFGVALAASQVVGGTLSTSIVVCAGAAAATYVGFRHSSPVRVPLAIGLAGIVIGAGTTWGVISGIFSKELALTELLFFFVLPGLNGVLDWISLSVSRWFGRAIIAERNSPASLAITLGLAIADLVAAVAFAFAVAWLLAFGIEVSGLAFGLSLELGGYIKRAAEAPWTSGIWATFMVLSTLVPTAIHLVLALGALLMAWSGNPLKQLAARRLEGGNEAEYLFPQLYLTFGWLLPWLVVPAALVWGLAHLTELFTFTLGPVETLPDLLRDTAWHGSDAAQRLFGGMNAGEVRTQAPPGLPLGDWDVWLAV